MKTFLNSKAPIITAILNSESQGKLLKEIKRVREEEAEAYCLQLEVLKSRYKRPSALKKIIDAMSDKPIYVTDGMRENRTEGITWEQIEKELLLALELGATLIDIPADMYVSSEEETAVNPEAIEKQMLFIDKIHKAGGEVLMSTHASRFVSKEEALTIAEEHRRRGADISKIIAEVQSEEELKESYAVCRALSTVPNLKYLFLCNGSFCKKQRLLAPTLGACIYPAVENALKDKSVHPTLKEGGVATSLFKIKFN